MIPEISYINAKALVGYVEHRGYRAEPVTLLADPSVVCGYTLLGPRGHKGFVGHCSIYGGFSLFEARLWCDCVDYASQQVALRRRVREVSRA